MNDHHLILGQTTDYLSGRTIPDTLDERFKQTISRYLVEEKLYLKTDITKDFKFVVHAGPKKAAVNIDFLINIKGHYCALIKYGPGSIITRHRSALALSRIIVPEMISLTIVTNGIDSDILNSSTGKLMSKHLSSLPNKSVMKRRIAEMHKQSITEKQKKLESRIVYAYEVDGCCPCDSSVCIIK